MSDNKKGRGIAVPVAFGLGAFVLLSAAGGLSRSGVFRVPFGDQAQNDWVKLIVSIAAVFLPALWDQVVDKVPMVKDLVEWRSDNRKRLESIEAKIDKLIEDVGKQKNP